MGEARAEDPIRHVPVMVEEVLQFLATAPPTFVFDGTVGLGGHARRILERFSSVEHYLGVDVDEDAVARAREELRPFGTRVSLRVGSYEEAERFIGDEASGRKPDAVLLDLGASTLQFKEPARGFSFSHAGPLDMRMDRGRSLQASDILGTYSAHQLQDIFSRYGEFRFSKTLAQAIAALPEPPSDTVELERLIKRVLPGSFVRTRRKNPAAQVFQALRIAVNDELGVLERALPSLFELLAPRGMFLAISFHSLEDRLVKTFFKSQLGVCTCPPGFPRCVCGSCKRLEIQTRRPVVASQDEVYDNPPSRSAKLRVARKL